MKPLENLIDIENVIRETLASRKYSGVFAFELPFGEGCKHPHMIYPIYGSDGTPTIYFATSLLKAGPTGFDKNSGDSVPLPLAGVKKVSGGFARSIAWGSGIGFTKEDVEREIHVAIDELVAIAA